MGKSTVKVNFEITHGENMVKTLCKYLAVTFIFVTCDGLIFFTFFDKN